jgi:hypothetical protein
MLTFPILFSSLLLLDAGVPAIAGVPAVAGILAIASVSANYGVHIFAVFFAYRYCNVQ